MPETERDRVYLLICKQDIRTLNAHWEQARRVLLGDLMSCERKRIDTAAYALISLGNEDVVPALVQALDARGNEDTVEMYLNCGHTKLQEAARRWADMHPGYTIPFAKWYPWLDWVQWSGALYRE